MRLGAPQRLEAPSLHQLHDDERPSVARRADVEDRDDAGMREPSRRAGFEEKPVLPLGLLPCAQLTRSAEELDGDPAADLRIVGGPHLSDGARTEALAESVA